ncbi:MAG: TIGR03960 family B12-binding radical SAM protein [Deltaproteobacteria bacterium]|nr:TIGR03960 family B12-binding radical SAM protein [Deltaproteobacteria bacterium]
MAGRVEIDLLLPLVQKPARYIGGEPGAANKHPDQVRLHVALCFPDIYEVAESHLGLKILYDAVNREPDLFAERVYAVWPDMAQALTARGLPLFGLETRTPLADFDLVAFSLNHELSYATVLHMLDQGQVPLLAAQRGERDPIVLAGGPAMSNPEPVAPFCDAVFVGDGDVAMVEIARALAARSDQPRARRLAALGEIEGIYLPARYASVLDEQGRPLPPRPLDGAPARVPSRLVADLDLVPSPRRWIVPHVDAVHNRAVVEIQRGCTRGCRFCQAGMIYRPTRQRSPQRAAADLALTIAATGYEQAGLLSLSAGDYGALDPLLAELRGTVEPRRVALSVPSLRVETLSPALADVVMSSRSGGFTLAPEAASDRLREVIAKGNREADLIRSLQAAFTAGATHVKLYFMIGLPTETDEDVIAIPALARRMLAAAREIQRRGRVSVSVSTFVPKPHTPFQWQEQITGDEVRRRQQLVRAGLDGSHIELRWHDAAASEIEGIYARGDRRLADVLLGAYRRGARLDAWTEHFDARRHLDALAAAGLSPHQFTRQRAGDEELPWEIVDYGLRRAFLWHERDLALRAPARGRSDCLVDTCHGCGVCDLWQAATGAGQEPRRLIGYWPRPDRSVARVEQPRRHRSNRGLTWPEPDAIPAEAPARRRPDRPARNADACAQRLRLTLRRHAPAVWLSHLETMSALSRALARARLPVAYSGGFHAKPRLSTAQALATGLASEHELVDVELSAYVPETEFQQRLAAELPAGLVVHAVQVVDRRRPGIGALVSGARYRARLGGEVGELADAARRFVEAVSWPLMRQRRDRSSEVDLKTLLDQVVLDQRSVEFTIRLAAGGTVKPAEALTAVFGAAAVDAAAIVKIATVVREPL